MLRFSRKVAVQNRATILRHRTATRCRTTISPIRSFSNGSSGDKGGKGARGPITFASLGLMLVVGSALLVYYDMEKEQKTKAMAKNVKTVGKAALGGPWVLVDADGVPRTDASYSDKFSLLYFGFTYCPDICPSELVKVGKIMDALERKNIPVVRPIFISVDPKRDTVGQLKHYSQDFHKDIEYLTGTTEQVAAAAKAYRVYFSKANENDDDEDDYLVDHSIVLYLVAPDGEFLDFFTQRMEVRDVVQRIEKHLENYKDVLKRIKQSEAATPAAAGGGTDRKK